jgi:hypothetical protein
MSIKMKKYFFLILLLLSAILLKAYEPEKKDFLNSYQFKLYRSWLEKSGCNADAPTAFQATKIVKLFTIQGKEVKVEYDWQDFKITNQRETISGFEYSLPAEIIVFLGSFLYRFNCADSSFVRDFLSITGTGLIYKNSSASAAINQLWDELGNSRFESSEIINILLEKETNSITIIFSNDQFQLILQDQQIDLTRLIIKESEKVIVESEKPVIKEEPSGITVDIPETMTLKEYISRNYHRKQTRELLHNKIGEVDDFLRLEFPGYEITASGDGFSISAESFQQFPVQLKVKYSRQDDGINIYSDNAHLVSGEEVEISREEKIDLSRLSDNEILSLAPYLPQLLYEHRAIGTRLLNFLLIHDNVPTTLLVKTEEREKYEIASYADLLLLLNKYWSDRDIYFKISDFKKVNNYIEFKGFLLAVEKEGFSADSAEIWFHLDKEFRIDLIMMMLYPDIKL